MGHSYHWHHGETFILMNFVSTIILGLLVRRPLSWAQAESLIYSDPVAKPFFRNHNDSNVYISTKLGTHVIPLNLLGQNFSSVKWSECYFYPIKLPDFPIMIFGAIGTKIYLLNPVSPVKIIATAERSISTSAYLTIPMQNGPYSFVMPTELEIERFINTAGVRISLVQIYLIELDREAKKLNFKQLNVQQFGDILNNRINFYRHLTSFDLSVKDQPDLTYHIACRGYVESNYVREIVIYTVCPSKALILTEVKLSQPRDGSLNIRAHAASVFTPDLSERFVIIVITEMVKNYTKIFAFKVSELVNAVVAVRKDCDNHVTSVSWFGREFGEHGTEPCDQSVNRLGKGRLCYETTSDDAISGRRAVTSVYKDEETFAIVYMTAVTATHPWNQILVVFLNLSYKAKICVYSPSFVKTKCSEAQITQIPTIQYQGKNLWYIHGALDLQQGRLRFYPDEAVSSEKPKSLTSLSLIDCKLPDTCLWCEGSGLAFGCNWSGESCSFGTRTDPATNICFQVQSITPRLTKPLANVPINIVISGISFGASPKISISIGSNLCEYKSHSAYHVQCIIVSPITGQFSPRLNVTLDDGKYTNLVAQSDATITISDDPSMLISDSSWLNLIIPISLLLFGGICIVIVTFYNRNSGENETPEPPMDPVSISTGSTAASMATATTVSKFGKTVTQRDTGYIPIATPSSPTTSFAGSTTNLSRTKPSAVSTVKTSFKTLSNVKDARKSVTKFSDPDIPMYTGKPKKDASLTTILPKSRLEQQSYKPMISYQAGPSQKEPSQMPMSSLSKRSQAPSAIQKAPISSVRSKVKSLPASSFAIESQAVGSTKPMSSYRPTPSRRKSIGAGASSTVKQSYAFSNVQSAIPPAQIPSPSTFSRAAPGGMKALSGISTYFGKQDKEFSAISKIIKSKKN